MPTSASARTSAARREALVCLTLTGLLLISVLAEAGGRLIIPSGGYVTTAGQLRDALAKTEDGVRVCVAVGAYKCAPVRVTARCMTSDQRADWWDNHQDASCTWVLALEETTRAAQR